MGALVDRDADTALVKHLFARHFDGRDPTEMLYKFMVNFSKKSVVRPCEVTTILRWKNSNKGQISSSKVTFVRPSL